MIAPDDTAGAGADNVAPHVCSQNGLAQLLVWSYRKPKRSTWGLLQYALQIAQVPARTSTHAKPDQMVQGPGHFLVQSCMQQLGMVGGG